jgi:uncharacterized protein (DUF952 family)
VIIYHIALASDWERAKTVGEYRISTRGRTLEDEGFIHASYANQVAGVAKAFYQGLSEPLVRLRIDTKRIPSEVIAENAGGGIELFPHIYGPLPVAAVLDTRPLVLDEDGDLIDGSAGPLATG